MYLFDYLYKKKMNFKYVYLIQNLAFVIGFVHFITEIK